jgi:hypothetical protein
MEQRVIKFICSSKAFYDLLAKKNLDDMELDAEIRCTLKGGQLSIGRMPGSRRFKVEADGNIDTSFEVLPLIRLRKVLHQIEDQPITVILSTESRYITLNGIVF